MSNIKTTWIDTSYLGIAQTESAQSDKRWPMPYCLCNTCFLLWLLRSASSCRSPSSGHRVCVCWTDWCSLVIGQIQLWGGGTWPIGWRRAGGERDMPVICPMNVAKACLAPAKYFWSEKVLSIWKILNRDTFLICDWILYIQFYFIRFIDQVVFYSIILLLHIILYLSIYDLFK